jgi:hypothetical protein
MKIHIRKQYQDRPGQAWPNGGPCKSISMGHEGFERLSHQEEQILPKSSSRDTLALPEKSIDGIQPLTPKKFFPEPLRKKILAFDNMGPFSSRNSQRGVQAPKSNALSQGLTPSNIFLGN